MMERPSAPQFRRKLVATFVQTPLPISNSFEAPFQPPPPPYEFLESRPAPAPTTRPNHKQDRPWVDERLRPSSRSEDASRLRPPDRLRVKTSLPNLSRHHNGFSPSTSPASSPLNLTPLSAPPPFGPDTPTTPSSTANASANSGFWQNAISETLHFAGGLIPHPTESTKHFTILRHSAPLVFYRGPTTSVAITIFSAHKYPLPPGRTLWLQQRGFSGDSGMALKSMMGATSDWLDVTPSVMVQAQELAPETETPWQRDIGKAARKSQKEKGDAKAHIPRETHVVRIPAVSSDGYFRFVLCSGGGIDIDGKATKRTLLCPSPIFRVASTSSDSSIMRGASFSTLPLEVGVKVASVAAKITINKYTGPVVGVVQGRMNKLKPGLVAKKVGQFASNSFQVNNNRDGNMDIGDHYTQPSPISYDGILGLDEGPQQPYPLKFQGKVAPGTGRNRAELGIPTANLINVSEDIKHNLRGVYFGWACIMPERGFEGLSGDWHEAVIATGPSPYARPSVIPENSVTVYLIHDFGHVGTTFFNARMKVVVMGFMRPLLSPAGAPIQQRLDTVSRDVYSTMASLGRENWGPELTIHRLKTAKSSRTLSDKYSDARDKVQRRVGSIPMHVVGIRTADAEARDKIHGNGGYWVPR
ncbi:hypothetical protein B0H63DRAFT_488636 [Podospora didyma]|uniref:Riboflavin kinase n=1 Tax=Podospora didyma TaxID=330526 RepID=A0AAE0K1T2_9PEZI|nr:hypothetical protein B0H63DRAFT_488636 [Podospora didyma]